MKTTSPIANLFARSPFRPMQEHMRVVEQCVSELVPLFEALEGGDMDRVRAQRDAVFELEHRADELKNEIRSRLPSGLFMPVPRKDLLDLLGKQDAIADAAQDIAGLLGMGKLRVPESMHPRLMAFLLRSLDAVRQCKTAIGELDELLEVGFRGRQVDRVSEMLDTLASIETETDSMGMELTQQLFDHEDEIGPLSVVFWFELLRNIGSVADEAENVGDRLRILIAR